MMNLRTFTLGIGIFYILVGILGFFSGVVSAPPVDAPKLVTEHGLLFGLFPVNTLHNIIHLAVGIWALGVFNNPAAARFYNQAISVAFVLLGLLGLIPNMNTFFGYIPIYGHDIWLHFLSALAAGYFGFISPVSFNMHHPRPADHSDRI